MRPTARAYMTIDTHRDERLDPWLAAEAAYAYLQEAYAMLGSWPLALTAYNHGPYGMRRAQKQFGNDLPALIRGYRSRSFGFASRNFYAEFLAARRVAEQPEHWFGPLPAAATLEVQQVTLSEWVTVDALTAFLGLDVPLLRQLNPALEEVVWTELGMVPEGYGLNLPRASALRLSEGWQGLPVEARYRRVAHVDWAVVREGDSLGLIARRHGTSVNRLRALNGLHRRRYIYPGERLKVSQTQRFVALSQLTGAGEPLHVVRRGETLSHIGERYGIRVADLITANGIRDASRLMAGQVLVLPGVR